MKKLIIGISLILNGITAVAGDNLIIYKCTYRIKKVGADEFKMSGNIIETDVVATEDYATYLTLAPNVSSGFSNIEARILITEDGYNPMTLHQAGNSTPTLAHTDLQGDRGEISYTDNAGTEHELECLKRTF